jgi:hypothetical protein
VEFVVALEGRWPEVKTRKINGLWVLCSVFGFDELLSVLDVFEGHPPPHAGVSLLREPSWINDSEFRRRVREIEEKNLRFERDTGFLQREVADFRRRNSRLATTNKVQKHEMNTPRKRPEMRITAS